MTSESILTTTSDNSPHDGIDIQDRALPRWWKRVFIATGMFGVGYLAFFESGAPDRSVIDRFRDAEVRLIKKQFGTLGDLPQDRTTMVKFMNSESWIKFGESTFKTHCQSCHGPDGGGIIGPNLTDYQWKNVQHLEDIIRVINVGAGNNAMPAWQQKLDPREITIVSAYVASRLGQPATNPKSPDGATIIKDWENDLKDIPDSDRNFPLQAK
jgi:cytochrome c oxidase cbb3-type subunit III